MIAQTKEKDNNPKSFKDLTNQYSLSKTLRFSLLPTDNTTKMLEDAKVFEKDETIQKKYQATKPYFDKLHREFVQEALQDQKLNFNDYLKDYKKWKLEKDSKKKKEYGKELQKNEKDLREEIVKLFDAQGENWADKYSGIELKKKDIGILFEEGVFKILKERYGEDDETKTLNEANGEEVSVFDSWKGFTGYFTKFFETRKNFYKADGTSTALATRIIDQNLKRFCDNILIFESIKEKVDFAEVEENFGKSLSEVFSLDFYNTCFLQDGIDFYNKILGGETKENGEKIKGLNECINKYKQDHKNEKLQFFKALDKQILSEKEGFIADEITEETLLENLQKFHQTAQEKTRILKMLFEDFVKNQEIYDLSQVYLSKESLNTISHKWTGETKVFEEALYEVLKKAKVVSSSAKKKEGSYSFPDFIALSFIKESLEKIPQEKSEKFWKERYYKLSLAEEGLSNEEIKKRGAENEQRPLENKENRPTWKQFLTIFEFEFSSLFDVEIERNIEKENDFQKILQSIKNTEKLISYNEEERKVKSQAGYNIFLEKFENLLQNFKSAHISPEDKVVIKNFADCVLTIYQMAKYFAVEKKRAWNTEYELDVFYTDPEKGYSLFYENAYEEIVQVYNKLRNYLTKKPYSEEKWKLNFDSGTPIKYTTRAIIFRDTTSGRYHLGLLKKGVAKPKEFEPIKNNTISSGEYQRMIIQQLKFQTLAGRGYIRDFGVKYSEDKDGIKHLQQLIKDQYLSKYPFLKDVAYGIFNDKKAFDTAIKDALLEAYNLDFQPISKEFILNKNRLGEIYLFEIHNKDWNLKDGENKLGAKNLHTMYFESLFVDKTTFKLNNEGAEVFYRPKTNEENLGTKKDKNGNKVINHKRYATDKVLFHCPIGLNRDAGKSYKFNAKINNFLANNPDINIIGIDRGEKHLAYFSVINQKGEILKDKNGNPISGSLNSVKGGNNQEINYAQKLEAVAKNREQARKDWQTIEGIKDLKRGYISQVVRKLADLAIKHNAIIVFEDLNMRFKQIRGGIEKSAYQQLEKALIEKLNFLVDKREKNPEEAGHLLNAYQLTAPFTKFKDLGKQTGIIFYTQAEYTSTTDPLTGWRKNIYPKSINKEKDIKTINQFESIIYNKQEDRFEFNYDLRNWGESGSDKDRKMKWTICSSVERFYWNNKDRKVKHYKDITKEIKDLLENNGISYEDKKDLKEEINQKSKDLQASFFRDFIFYIKLILQIRNTDKEKEGNENDFIMSPVCDDIGRFFDSRKAKDFGPYFPQNGDENGALNIARKGIILLERISHFKNDKGDCEKMSWADMYIDKISWDKFTQKWNNTSKSQK